MKVIMPQIGMTMVEGTITQWLVQDGEKVEKGQPLLEVTTEKLSNEIEAPATGILKIFAQVEETITCGEDIAEIIED